MVMFITELSGVVQCNNEPVRGGENFYFHLQVISKAV